MPPAGRGDGDRRRGRAPLPLLQGDHGGQVQAGRQPDRRRPRASTPSQVGAAGAGQEITDVSEAEARAAGEIVVDEGDGARACRGLPRAAEGGLRCAIDKVWVLAEVADGGAHPRHARAADRGPRRRPRPSRPSPGATTPPRWPAPSASTARPRVYDVGDLGGALPGVPVAAALAALVDGGQRARRHPLPGHLRRA